MTFDQLPQEVTVYGFTWEKLQELRVYQKDTTQVYGMYSTKGHSIDEGHFSIFCVKEGISRGMIINVHFTEGGRNFVFFDAGTNTIRLATAIQDENLQIASQHAKMLAKFLQKSGISQTAVTKLTFVADSLAGFQTVGSGKKA